MVTQDEFYSIIEIKNAPTLASKSMLIFLSMPRGLAPRSFTAILTFSKIALLFLRCFQADIKARGTEDNLIVATDNLNGFTDTIKNVFPESETQICVVNQTCLATATVTPQV